MSHQIKFKNKTFFSLLQKNFFLLVRPRTEEATKTGKGCSSKKNASKEKKMQTKT
jgi:hypothetical protein